MNLLLQLQTRGPAIASQSAGFGDALAIGMAALLVVALVIIALDHQADTK